MKYASVQTLEKIPRAIELTARGVAGHGSVPLKSNPLARLAKAVDKVVEWQPPITINETTGTYFKRLAALSSPEDAKRYRDVLSPDPKVSAPAGEYFREHEPFHASVLRTSISPTIIQAGYRVNVIPSEGKATLDVRVHPDEDVEQVLEQVKRVVNDPAIDVAWAPRDVAKAAGARR